MVATPRATTAAKLPIHCQLWFNSHTSKYEAKLRANNGKNTLKPTEAASPIPRKILIIVSEVIFHHLGNAAMAFRRYEFNLFRINKKIIGKTYQVQLMFSPCNCSIQPP